MTLDRKSREAAVEAELVKRVEAAGGLCVKTVSPSGRGFFDRVIVLPGGRVVFCEVKRPKGGRLSPHQKILHDAFRQRGAAVAVIRCAADIELLLQDAGTAA